MAAGSTKIKGNGKAIRTRAPGTPPPPVMKATLRVSRRAASEGGRHSIRVALGPLEEVDVTGALTSPLAHALWQLKGGADIGNWVDAERLLDELLGCFAAASPVRDRAMERGPQVVVPGKRARLQS